MESDNFTGILQSTADNPSPGFRALRRLKETVGSGDFSMAARALKMGKVRERRASIIEKVDGEMQIHERSLRKGIGDHNLTAAMAGYAIGKLLDLEGEEKTDLIIGPMCHDATKPLEVTLMGYRSMAQAGKTGEDERKVLKKVFTVPGLQIEEAKIIDLTVIEDPVEFAEKFDTDINIPFLEFSFFQLESARRQRLVSITSSDSVAALPLAIERANHFAQKEKDFFRDSKLPLELEKLVEALSGNRKAHKVTGEIEDRLGLLLLFCDSLVTNRFVTPRQRLEDVINRNAYGQLEASFENRYFGNNARYWPAALTVALATQEIITVQAIRKNKIPKNTSPDDLPKIIYEMVQHLS